MAVLKDTGGQRTRLSKHKAAGFIEQMSQKGVRLRAKGKNTAPKVISVKPELQLELREGDSLQVTSQLVTPGGVVIEKPACLKDLSRDNGWFANGDNLYKYESISGSTDYLVLGASQPIRLTGDAVPCFLQDIAQYESQFEAIEKNERPAELFVYGEEHEDRLRVSGDRNSIRIDPALVYVKPPVVVPRCRTLFQGDTQRVAPHQGA